MRNSIVTPIFTTPKHLNKGSRLYFHMAVKANRPSTIQEKRFLPSIDAEKLAAANLIKELLRETGIALEK